MSGVTSGNTAAEIKKTAAFTILSNQEDGIAFALNHFAKTVSAIKREELDHEASDQLSD